MRDRSEPWEVAILVDFCWDKNILASNLDPQGVFTL